MVMNLVEVNAPYTCTGPMQIGYSRQSDGRFLLLLLREVAM